MTYILKTKRLGFRQWQESDRAPLRAMNADPAVMEFFPSLMTHDEVDGMMERLVDHIDTHGFGFFAVDRLDLSESGSFIGFIGLGYSRTELDFGRFVEIGWRTIPSSWGIGLASEGAVAIMKYGLEDLGLKEIYSMTSVVNKRSERIMQKLGMEHDRFFDFPSMPSEHPLCRHTLYKKVRA